MSLYDSLSGYDPESLPELIPVIGLEVHLQLRTESKLFCSCSAQYGGTPNAQICPTCSGLPGAMPVLNERAVRLAVRTARALHCRVHERSLFVRKNYFYPDLPKGYQISQYEQPVATHGRFEIDFTDSPRDVTIRRVHLEEDAGKLIHTSDGLTLVDLNRCGVPLLEIVTEPELRNPVEACHFLRRLRQLVLYLDVSEAGMEEGGLRCDANVSLVPRDGRGPGQKTELKNLNSFRYIERALSKEIERQASILTSGGMIVQETLLWDEEGSEVRVMRGKEQAHDYRYFPEPDLPPLEIEPSLIRAETRKLPELPLKRLERFRTVLGLTGYSADVLTSEKGLADYFEETVHSGAPAQKAANWVMGEVRAVLKRTGTVASELPVKPSSLAVLIRRVEQGTLGITEARKIFTMALEEGRPPEEILRSVEFDRAGTPLELETVIENVLRELAPLVVRYRRGKTTVIERFVGEVMKRTGGRADPCGVRERIRELIENQAG